MVVGGKQKHPRQQKHPPKSSSSKPKPKKVEITPQNRPSNHIDTDEDIFDKPHTDIIFDPRNGFMEDNFLISIPDQLETFSIEIDSDLLNDQIKNIPKYQLLGLHKSDVADKDQEFLETEFPEISLSISPDKKDETFDISQLRIIKKPPPRKESTDSSEQIDKNSIESLENWLDDVL